MKKILTGMLCVGLALAMVGSAVAEPPEGGPPRRERGPRGDGPPGRAGKGRPPGMHGGPVMAVLDVDKDGKLSAEEIEKAADALRLLDKDGDGQLTRDELRPPRGERGQGRRGPGEGSGRGRRRSRPEGSGRGREGRGPGDIGPPGDRGPRRGPPDGHEARGPHVLPPGAREHLDLSDEQIAKIDALEQEVKTKVQEILEPEQLERLTRMFRRGPGGPGGRGRFVDGPEGPPRRPDRPRSPRD